MVKTGGPCQENNSSVLAWIIQISNRACKAAIDVYPDFGNELEVFNVDFDLVAGYKGLSGLVLFLDLDSLDEIGVPFWVC